MNDFKAISAASWLAEERYRCPRRHLRNLSLPKVKESEGYKARIVSDFGDQRSTAPRHHAGNADLPLHDRLHAIFEATYGCELGPILITQGEVEEQVLDRV